MIFIGDISSPNLKTSEDLMDSLKSFKDILSGKPVIGNLEGLLLDSQVNSTKTLIFNNSSILIPLNSINTRLVSLANNHTLDFPSQIEFTKNHLKSSNISYCGADKYRKDAESSTKLAINGRHTHFLSYSWDVLMQHQRNLDGNLYVNTLDPLKCIADVKKIREIDKSSLIVLLMHWNFDLETLPFPLYRELSKTLIDVGANAIIGSHSHCVQGGERYKDGFIIYSLGNFYFPWYEYRNKTSFFPDWTKLELMLDWNQVTNELTCHWLEYSYTKNKHMLKYMSSENFDNGELISKLSPYRNLNEKNYISFYKKNRRKSFLIPIYKNYNSVLENSLYDLYLKKRIRAARFLASKKLKSWNN